MENYQFKNLDYYKSIKSIGMRPKIERVWCKYRAPQYIGYCMILVKKYKVKTLEEFYQKYIHDVTTPDDLYHGRSIDMLLNIAFKWREECKSNLPLETFMDLVILHTIVETWFGYWPEMEIIDILEKNGYTIVNPDEIFKDKIGYVKGMFDSKCSIDIIAEKNGVITQIIQVKPKSTFTSNNPSTINDRYSFLEHNRKGINYLKQNGLAVDDNIYVKYMIYVDDNWLYKVDKNKDVFSFTLEELLEKNYVKNLLKEKQYKKISLKR